MITHLAEVFFEALLEFVRQYHPEAVVVISYSEVQNVSSYQYSVPQVEVLFEDLYGYTQTMIYEGDFGDLFGELINE